MTTKKIARGRQAYRMIVAVLVLAACSGGEDEGAVPDAADSSEVSSDGESPESLSMDSVCARGAEERSLIHWHNYGDGMADVYAAFNEQYPDIDVEALTMTPDDMAQRVLTEHLSGRTLSVDVVSGDLAVFQSVIGEGMIDSEVDWVELGVPADMVHDTNVIRNHRNAMGLAYNTEAVSADMLPDTWEELVDERWRGMTSVDPRGRPFDQMALQMGADQALDYVQRFRDTAQPLVIEGTTASMVAVASGEIAFTTAGRSAETLEQQADGQPIEIKFLDLVPTNDSYNLVLGDGEHLNAARCYAVWFSTVGQPIYLDSEFKSNDTIPPAAPEDAEIVSIESPEDAQTVSEVGREMGRIWTNQ